MLVKAINNVSTAASIIGAEVDLQFTYTWACEFEWDGTTDGTVKIQGSVNGTIWEDIVGASQATGGAPGTYFKNIDTFIGYLFVRPVFTRTGGTGNMNCYISGKEHTLTSENAASFIYVGEKYVRSTRFAEIVAGTSGTVTLPPGSEVVLDDFGGTTDAVVAKIQGGKPLYEHPIDGLGNIIATTFDSDGNYSFTGTPTAYPVAIVYRVKQQLKDFDSNSADIIGGVDFEITQPFEFSFGVGVPNPVSGSDGDIYIDTANGNHYKKVLGAWVYAWGDDATFSTRLSSPILRSTVATGTAPLQIASTTLVANLYAARSALADTVTTNANLTGDVTSVGNATTIANLAVTNAKIANGTIDLTTKVTGILPNANTTATSLNTASAIVARDGAGNFAAGTITASLAGNASTATLAATVTTNANLTGPVTSVGNATALATQQVHSAATDTTTSTTDVALPLMTLTPPAGTYLVLFNHQVESSAANRNIFSTVYVDGTANTASERFWNPGGAASGQNALATLAVVTVNGSEAINIRWRISASTATSYRKSMFLFRIA